MIHACNSNAKEEEEAAAEERERKQQRKKSSSSTKKEIKFHANQLENERSDKKTEL